MGSSLYDGIISPSGGLVTPQSAVDDMYRGIYPPAPSSNVARVTPEGLNVNKVQTVAIDPRTGNPVTVGGKSSNTQAVLHPSAPPANYGTAPLGYTDNTQIVRNLSPNGSYSDPLTAANAEASGYVPKPWAPIGGFVFPKSTGGLVFDGPNNQSRPYSGGDAWHADRFGDEPVVQRPGLVTGPIMAATAARPQAQQMPIMAAGAAPRPITYSAPVAAGNFAQGSPNQSFEKQNGMGSVTNSMASSSRWNTGY